MICCHCDHKTDQVTVEPIRKVGETIVQGHVCKDKGGCFERTQ